MGEAFVDFQRALKDLKRRGMVLGIVSKNEESVALEAIRQHPEMVLREDDFVGWRINWSDKAQNIAELAAELNLGLQSVVFIDDNPVERARVREALPEVLVPEWPEDKLLYPSALERAALLRRPARQRAKTSSAPGSTPKSASATQLQKQVGSMDDWLKSLEHQGARRAVVARQPGARHAAAQQDQPDEPEHAPADRGRAHGVGSRARAPVLGGQRLRQVRRRGSHRAGQPRVRRAARRASSTTCSAAASWAARSRRPWCTWR